MIQTEILVLIAFTCLGLVEMGYIGAHGVAALHRYKYSGVDHSYVAKYVLQPFWSRFVHFFPLWMPYVSSSFFSTLYFVQFFLSTLCVCATLAEYTILVQLWNRVFKKRFPFFWNYNWNRVLNTQFSRLCV